jgi:hypothetical protein
MGKFKRRAIGLGVAGASAGVLLFTPFGNNLAKDIFYKSEEAPIPERVYPEEMTDVASGGTFDTSRFYAEDRAYTSRQEAVDDTIWYTGTLNNHRVNAAALCGLLAANEFDIPQGAKDGWKAAEAAPSTTEAEVNAKDTAYDAIGKLCIDTFPIINPEGTPEANLVAKKVTIFVAVAS